MRTYKLVKSDYGSINDNYCRVIYTEEWQDIPGNGAYCSETEVGICSGGVGEKLIELEVEDERLDLGIPGVRCWGRARMIREIPLPAEYDRARAAWERARAECERARAACERAWAACERARAEWVRAWAEYERARAEYDRARAEWERAWAECERAWAEYEQIVVEVIKGITK